MKLSRRQLAEYIIAHPGDAAIKQVAGYLVSEGRAKEVNLVIREVEVILEKRGRTVARVGSARKLDADQQRKVISMLKSRDNVQSVEIINEVDPSLLGGVVVRTPGMEVDVSVREKLNRLRSAAWEN